MNSLFATAAIKAQVFANTALNKVADEMKDVLGDDWNIVNVITNTGGLLKSVGTALMVVIGIMIIVGIVKIATGLISHGKTQVNWVVNILLIAVGALFCAGAAMFAFLTDTSNNSFGGALSCTITDLGNE